MVALLYKVALQSISTLKCKAALALSTETQSQNSNFVSLESDLNFPKNSDVKTQRVNSS